MGSINTAKIMPETRVQVRKRQAAGQSNRNVDESLFGNQKRRPNKTKIQVVDRTLIRDLIVPQERQNEETYAVLPSDEYRRLKDASKMVTKQQKHHEEESLQKQKQTRQEESMARRSYMEEMDRNRRAKQQIENIDDDVKQARELTISRAQEQMAEREAAVRKMNELILNAKCHAIRDAQIVEKALLKNELDEEDKRLDRYMEEQRKEAEKELKGRADKLEETRKAQIEQLRQQIEEKEVTRIIETEQRNREALMLRQQQEQLLKEELADIQAKKERQKEAKLELIKENEEAIKKKKWMEEEEKRLEKEIEAYQREKNDREEQWFVEQQRIREAKEKELFRMLQQQKRVQDTLNEKLNLQARRSQEKAERDWRQKVRENAEKKAKLDAELKQNRQSQIETKHFLLARQAEQEKEEFEKLVKSHEKEVKKERALEERKMKACAMYADQVRQQIQDKEKQRIAERSQCFALGTKIGEEVRKRENLLLEVKKRKLEELRQSKIPEKYINEVSRQLNKIKLDM